MPLFSSGKAIAWMRALGSQVVQLSVSGKRYGCPMSAQAALKDGEKMKYRLAGFDFATKEEAEKAQKILNCKLKGCDPDCIKDCMKNFRGTAQTAGAKKGGCNKAKAAAATVAAKDGSPCPHALGAGAQFVCHVHGAQTGARY